MAWKGLKAEGFPEVAMNYFGSASSTEELIIMAWHLEEGTRKFYTKLLPLFANQEILRLFEDLGKAEQKHKSMLEGLYGEIAGKQFEIDYSFGQSEVDQLMEGGVKIQEALDWASAKAEKDIVEFAMALEANAYDRYLTMRRMFDSEDSKRVFNSLSEAEKQHLERLTEAFEAIA